MRPLIGIDLGTTACKVTVVRSDGTLHSRTSAAYGIDSPHRGWAEQDPDGWWGVVRECMDRVTREADIPLTGASVSFTGQMHSLVLLDARGRVLRPSILWCDRRAASQSLEVEATIDDYRAITGNQSLPAFTLPQLLWVRENEPVTYSQVAAALVTKDFLRLRATGELATDWTDASGTGMLDSGSRRWSEEILDGLGIDEGILPPVRDPTESGGNADALIPGASTAIGVGDQFAEALSAGVLEAGDLAVSLGTSATLLGVSDQRVLGAFCHAPADRWLRLESLHAGAKSLEWFADLFLSGAPISEVTRLAADSRPGANGVRFLPFLLGERRMRGRGAPAGFVGADLSTTISDMARAVLEGVAFDLRRLHDTQHWLASSTPITIKGGGSRSALWAEIVGTTFERPYRIGSRDAAFGAAMVAGVASRRWAGFSDVPMPDADVFEPAQEGSEALADAYAEYCSLVNSLSSMAST